MNWLEMGVLWWVISSVLYVLIGLLRQLDWDQSRQRDRERDERLEQIGISLHDLIEIIDEEHGSFRRRLDAIENHMRHEPYERSGR